MKITDELVDLARAEGIRKIEYLSLFENPDDPKALKKAFQSFKKESPELFGDPALPGESGKKGRERIYEHYANKQTEDNES